MEDDDLDELLNEFQRATAVKKLTSTLMMVCDISPLSTQDCIRACCVMLGTAIKVMIENDNVKKGHEHAYIQEVLSLVREIAEGKWDKKS